jgi:DNA-damage-inducible protein J
MAKNTVISVRVQEETKKEAERLFEEMGLSMSTAVNLFLKQVVRTGKIPFELSAEERRNP